GQSLSPPGGDAVRGYVDKGGSLYASDFAGAVIKAAFPEMLDFIQEGHPCKSLCEVVDPGLREIIGPEINIHFDLGGWWQISRTHHTVRIYAKWKVMPIIVGFQFGKGHVTYTSFHNEAQVSEAERQLLRFLVL